MKKAAPQGCELGIAVAMTNKSNIWKHKKFTYLTKSLLRYIKLPKCRFSRSFE
jgi:hypothetical protein